MIARHYLFNEIQGQYPNYCHMNVSVGLGVGVGVGVGVSRQIG